MWSGWGPDYADPQTFLHTMIVGGDMVEQLGF
jgi:ABC-type oligopeptide transport system substrate-binding subunit